MFNKGAMFGLDARIALAIFGALSVISGAALYSAIQEADVEKFRQLFVESIKASEAYYLDNGEPLPALDANNIKTISLVQNTENLTSWKGPYFNADELIGEFGIQNNVTNSIDASTFLEIYIQIRSEWPQNLTYNNCTTGSNDCAEFSRLQFGVTEANEIRAKQIFSKLDEQIDGSDGALNGKIRTMDPPGFGYSIFYLGIPRVR
jgi:hypothetical protein